MQVVENGQLAIDYLSGVGSYRDRAAFPLPVVMLLDLKLPFRSGLEVLEWTRKQPQLSGVIIVVLTSSNERWDLRESYRLGANSYLVKPPTAEQLLDMAKAFKWYWIKHNQFDTDAEERTKSSP